MLRRLEVRLSRVFEHNLKFPALISYNKLPWEIINHETPALHMHLAPQYEQILTLASTTNVPHLVKPTHPVVEVEHRLRTLPGVLYLMKGNAIPTGFNPYTVTDHVALQYYGPLNHNLAHVKQVRILTSEDLRLLCLCITFDTINISVAPYSALNNFTRYKMEEGSEHMEEIELEEELQEQQKNAKGVVDSDSSTTDNDNIFSLYHYFRPNRPVSELTRPLEKFYVHRPNLSMFASFTSATSSINNNKDNNIIDNNSSVNVWQPRLNVHKRAKNAKVTPLPLYRPPQSYLMGLAERLAIVPGNCFGKRYLMWGYWF